MKLVFFDPKCPRPYDSRALVAQGLGGTEATVVRVANALSAEHDVTVLQHNREHAVEEHGSLRFLPVTQGSSYISRANHVVFIQKAQHITRVARQTRGRLWLWLHNYLVDEVPYFWQDHFRHRLGIVCVSQTHAEHTRQHITGLSVNRWSFGFLERAGIVHIHNPIDDALAPDPSVMRDKCKLVFFSSPYKGIEHVLEYFGAAYLKCSDLRLFVADPGYVKNFDASSLRHPGIVVLGSLPQREVLKHVREALCVFYPQYRRPETFGLVYAEANAVGTPVLAHDFGAAREVLGTQNPPLDARDREAVLRRLFDWHSGAAPVVSRDERFRLSSVAAQWRSLLVDPDTFVREQRA